MKICVVGAAGNMALGALRDFAESRDVDEIILADVNGKALEARKRELASDKASAVQVDVTNSQALEQALSGCDACLNASLPYFNVAVMRACLQSGVHYTDLGGLFHWAKEQLALSDEFAEAGLTAVLGSGSAPGIVNVMARYAYLRLDTVDSVKITDGIVNFATATSAPLKPPYSLDTILNEFTMNPWAFIDGEWKEFPPFSGGEVIDFPDPVGSQTAYYTIHSEPRTIPVSFRDKGIREVTFQLSLPKSFEEKLRFLVDLGMGGTDGVALDGGTVSPRDMLLHLVTSSNATMTPSTEYDDHKVLRVTVRGSLDNEAQEYVLESILHPSADWCMPCSAWTVGFPAAVTTRLLGNGVIEARGAFGGEACIPPETYFAELAKRGIEVSVRKAQ